MKIYNLLSDNQKIKNIGGKALPIREISQKGILVPVSYVVGYDFFEDHLAKINFWNKIDFKKLSLKNQKLNSILSQARRIITQSKINSSLSEQIKAVNNKARFWAVRSSANIEDTKDKSWAGKFKSYLGIRDSQLEYYIKRVWASLFTVNVISYLNKEKDILNIKMAVLLQEIIESEVAGVCFTSNLFTNNLDEMIIEAVHGFGDYLVQGKAKPDKYLINKKNGIISEVNFNEQKKKLSLSREGFLEETINKLKDYQKLNGKEIMQLYEILKKIEKMSCSPQDIEWSFSRNNYYILQSRPIVN